MCYTVPEDLQNGALNTMKPTWHPGKSIFFLQLLFTGFIRAPALGVFRIKKYKNKAFIILALHPASATGFLFKKIES